MKSYWDTSAAINALFSTAVWDRLDTGDHCTRAHMFSEWFSIMTKRGVDVKDAHGSPCVIVLSAQDSSTWLKRFSKRVQLVELTLDETLDSFSKAPNSITGGKVHDYIHALAADKAGSDVLLTRNTSDFQATGCKARVEWP